MSENGLRQFIAYFFEMMCQTTKWKGFLSNFQDEFNYRKTEVKEQELWTMDLAKKQFSMN